MRLYFSEINDLKVRSILLVSMLSDMSTIQLLSLISILQCRLASSSKDVN